MKLYFMSLTYRDGDPNNGIRRATFSPAPDGVDALRRLREKCKRQPTYLISEKNANALIKRHGLSFAQGESELSGFIIFKSDVTF